MSTLVEILNHRFLFGLSNPRARDVFLKEWEQVNGENWEALYLKALRSSMDKVLPRFEAYANGDSVTLDELVLRNALDWDLTGLPETEQLAGLRPEEFAAAVAPAMARQAVFMINGRYLAEQDYIILVTDWVHQLEDDFKMGINSQSSAFQSALLAQAEDDVEVTGQVEQYLAARFAVTLKAAESAHSPLDAASIGEAVAPASPTRAQKSHGELRILVAAPADVAAEREQIMRVLDELGSRSASGLGINFRLVEGNPADPDWDVFVGAVWLRFGGADNGHQSGSEKDFEAAYQRMESAADGWPKCIIYRCTKPPVDLLSFDITEYMRVQQFFARANAITAPKVLLQHYTQREEIDQRLYDQLAAYVTEFAGTQATRLTSEGLNAENNARWDEAVSLYEQAADLFNLLALPDSKVMIAEYIARAKRLSKEEVAREAAARGDYARTTQDWFEAESAYQSGLGYARELGDSEQQGAFLRSLGSVAAERQRWSDALNYYEEAKRFFDSPDQVSNRRSVVADQIIALERLGSLHQVARDWTNAAEYYQRALAFAIELGDGNKQAALSYQLGLLAEEQDEWRDALEHYNQTLKWLTAPEQLDQKLSVMHRQSVALEKIGDAARARDDWREAEASYRDGLGIIESLGDPLREPELVDKLAGVIEAQTRWSEALEYQRRAVAGFDQTGRSDRSQLIKSREAVALEKLGDLAQDEKNWEHAQGAYQESLFLVQESGDRASQAGLLFKLGLLTEGLSQWADSLGYYHQALLLFGEMEAVERQSTVMQHELIVLGQLGDSAREEHNPDRAAAYYSQALVWAQHLGDQSAEAQLLWKLGLVSADQDQWAQAVGYYDQALGHLDGDGTEAARRVIIDNQMFALEKLGDLAFGDNKWDRAESTYQQALQLVRQRDDPQTEVALLDKLGTVAENQEQWPTAVERYGQALERTKELGSSQLHSAISQHLERAERGVKRVAAAEALARGDAARGERRWEQAESAYLESLALTENLGDRAREGELLHKLGLLSEDRSQWLDALTYYRQALPIISEQGARDAQVQVLWNLGRAQRNAQRAAAIEALEQGDAARGEHNWEEAASSYGRSLTLARKLSNTTHEGETLYRLGLLAAAQENWSEAFEYYEQALGRFDAEEHAKKRETIMKDESFAVTHLGDAMRAAKNWEQADSSYRFSLALAQALGNQPEQGALLSKLGLLAADQGKWQDAIGYYEEAKTELGDPALVEARLQVSRNQAVAFEQLGDTALDTKDWAKADDAYQASLILAEEIRDQAVQAQLRRKLGILAEDQGQWEAAGSHYEGSLALLHEIGLAEQQAIVSEAVERVRRAKKREEAEQITANGDLALQAKEWDRAAEEYQRAHEIYADLPLQDGLDSVSAKVEQAHRGKKLESAEQAVAAGDSAVAARQWDGGIEHYQHALDLFAELALADEQATASARITQARQGKQQEAAERAVANGDGAFDAREWDAAIGHYQQAQSLFAELPLPEAQAQAAAKLEQAQQNQQRQEAAEQAIANGDAAMTRGEWDSAIEHYRQAQAPFARLPLEDAQAQVGEKLEQAQRGKKQQTAEQAVAAGDAAAAAGQWDFAFAHYQQAQALFAELPLPEAQAQAAAKLEQAQQNQQRQEAGEQAIASGDAAMTRGEWDSAIEHYQQAQALFVDLPLPDAQADLATKLEQAQDEKQRQNEGEQAVASGDSAVAKGEWDSAIEHYQQAQALFVDLPLPDAQADLATKLEQAQRGKKRQTAEQAVFSGDAAFVARQWAAAVELYQQAHDIYAGLELPETQANVSAQIVQAQQGKQQEAGETAVAAGDTAMSAHEWTSAVEHYQQAQALFAELPLPEAQAQAAAKLEQAQQNQQRQEAAEQALANGDSALDARQWDASVEQYQLALDLFAEIGMVDEQATVSAKIERTLRAKHQEAAERAAAEGDAARDAGQWDLAIEQYRQAHDIYGAFDFDDERASLSTKIGETQRAKLQEDAGQAVTDGDAAVEAGDWDAAVAMYQNAEKLFAQLELTDAEAQVSAKLGHAQREMKKRAAAKEADRARNARAAQNWGEAESAYSASLQLRTELGERGGEAELHHALGEVAEAQEVWDKAAASHERALAIFVQVQDQTNQAAALKKIGDAYRHGARWAEAESAYRQALRIATDSQDRRREGELLNHFGMLEAAQGHWEEAHANYKQALRIFKALELHGAQTEVWRNIGHAERGEKSSAAADAASVGDAKRKAKDWNAANEAYRHSLALSEELGDRVGEAWRWNDLGTLAADQEQWSTARENYQHALEIFQKLRASDAEAQVWRQFASSEQAAMEWNSSEDALRRSLALSEELGDRSGEAWRWNDLGSLAAAQEHWRVAQDNYGHALEIFQDLELPDEQLTVWRNLLKAQSGAHLQNLAQAREQGNRARQGQLLNDLGLIAEKLEESSGALAYYKQALEVFEAMNLTNAQLTVWRNIGDVQRLNRNWDEAEASYRQCLTLAQQLGFRNSEANSLGLLGLVAEGREEWDQALEFHQAALDIFEELGDVRNHAVALEKVGDAQRGGQRWAEAESAYRQDLALAHERQDASREGHILNKLGLLSADQELWDEAIDSYQRSLRAFETTDSPLDEAHVLDNLGDAQSGTCNWTRATEAYEAAQSIYRELADRTNQAWSIAKLARLDQAQRQWPKAAERLDTALDLFRSLQQPRHEATILKEQARLKIQTEELMEAEALAKSALTIIQNQQDPVSESKTLRLLADIAFEREEMQDAYERLEQAIQLNPRNWGAHVDLALALLFPGRAGDAIQESNECLGHGARPQLGAQIVLALARHFINDVRGLRAELRRTKALIADGESKHSVHHVFVESALGVVQALEGTGDSALASLERLSTAPPSNESREAYRFTRLALLLLSRSPRRLRSRSALSRYFKAARGKRQKRADQTGPALTPADDGQAREESRPIV